MKTIKISAIYKCFAAILTIGVVAFWAIEKGEAAAEDWPRLPKLVLEDCVAAERSIKPNPFSKFVNDFFMITTYEEYEDTGRVIKKKPDARGRGAALNVYLVLGVLITPDSTIGLVHYMGLIVTERNIGASRNAEPTLRRWILWDEDGDGRLDKARFSESVNGSSDETAESHEVEIPSEQVTRLQGYFEEAVSRLSKKAAAGSDKPCRLS